MNRRDLISETGVVARTQNKHEGVKQRHELCKNVLSLFTVCAELQKGGTNF